MARTVKFVMMGVLALALGLGRAAAFPIFKIAFDPLLPSDRDPFSVFFSVGCPATFGPPQVVGHQITISGFNLPTTLPCTGSTTVIPVGPLPAGSYTVTVALNGQVQGTQGIAIWKTATAEGDLQPSPRLPTTSDPLRLTATVRAGCRVTFGPPSVLFDRIVIPASTSTPCQRETVSTSEAVSVGPLLAGAYTAELEIDGATAATQGLLVTAPAPALSLLSGRFAVTVERPDGSGPAPAVQLGDESGYFWFFDSGNVELTAKILDGRAVNGHFWVFLASMTDVPYTVTVVDLRGSCLQCPSRTYLNPAGRNGNFIDTNAFAGASRALRAPAATAGAIVPVPPRLTVSPRLPTTADAIDLHVTLAGLGCPESVAPPRLTGSVIAYDVISPPSCPSYPDPPAAVGSVGPLPAGLYTVEARVNGSLVDSQPLQVSAPAAALPLLGGIDLTLDWRLPGGAGTARAVALSDESGYFWFFDPKNVEITAKLLDGHAVNGHLWLFLASMTDVAYTLTVVDRRFPDCTLSAPGCPTKIYTSPGGKNANLIDVNLF